MARSLALLLFPAAALASGGAFAAPQTILYETDFSGVDGWALTGSSVAWDVDALPAGPMIPYHSPPSSLNFNNDSQGLPWGLWFGTATSPVIDLSRASTSVHLDFWFGWRHEGDCTWDAFLLTVKSEATGQVHHSECLSVFNNGFGTWVPHSIPLDPAWGEVRVQFVHDTIDDWNFNDQGSFVDDLQVVADCVGASVHCDASPLTTGAPGATLTVDGTLSIAAGDLFLRGDGFPAQTFAAAFAGPPSTPFPLGAGTRCIALSGSLRLGIAPTRDFGRPNWTLDLDAWPLSQIAAVGQPLYVQAIFRDGTTFNLSQALELVPCP